MDKKIKDVLLRYGIVNINELVQIYESAWSIDNTYILKKNANLAELEKSIELSKRLADENIPVAKYFMTNDGQSYVYFDGDFCYCLMSKLSGQHIDPYKGDYYKTGKQLGNIVANLHIALKKLDSSFECHEADLIKELKGWISHEIKEKNISISQEIIDKCYEFEKVYSRLPRQLIHRDVHMGNLLFEEGNFVGYLDFDISQNNVRIFDICYLGAGLLVENYKDVEKLCQWKKIFSGILEGYEEISVLSSDEKNAIPMMFIMIELIFAAYFSKIGQYDISKNCIDMVNWLYKNIDKIQGIILSRGLGI